MTDGSKKPFSLYKVLSYNIKDFLVPPLHDKRPWMQ